MIYTGTNIRLILETGINLSGATQPRIRWAVGNLSGVWNAQVDGTTIFYDTQTSDLAVAGLWQLQSDCVVDGKVFKGKIATLNINNPIKV